MNLEFLRHNHLDMLSNMESSGYSAIYIYAFRKEIERIIERAELEGWKSYEDIYRCYEADVKQHGALQTKHAALGALRQFELHRKYPNSRWSGFLGKSSYHSLNREFKGLVDHYSKKSEGLNLKKVSVGSHVSTISTFLLAIQELCINRFEDITEEAVLSVFLSPEGKPLKEQTYGWRISKVFEVCISMNPVVYRNILSFIPRFKRKRKNIQYLTTQEADKIREHLDDANNALSLRDRAIGKLLLHTGLRSSDIAALSLDSIDWELDIIKIEQKKTGVPLELPMNAVVGNAIFDYLTNERGHVDTDALFPSRRGHARPITSANIYHAVNRIMKAAGMRQTEGDRKGTHIFRHRLATTLLGNDVSQVVVSSTLGHTSPRSTEPYFFADFVHLKECALDISCFPLSEEEVFSVE